MQKETLPIGVFDSGVGGVSVLRHLVSLMPNENYIYLGDNKNAPYGTKSRDEISLCAKECANLLCSKGVKAMVVACNTATSVCIDDLRQNYPDFPIVGIEPAVKPALQDKRNSAVAVMATPLTLKEKKFAVLLEEVGKDAEIIPLPCPGLMELVEEGLFGSDEAYRYLEKLFSQIKTPDSLVLGCTHYPFLIGAIKKVLPDVRIYDGGIGTAKQLKRLLEEKNLVSPSRTKGSVEFINTLNDKNQNELAKTLLKCENLL